MTMFAHAAGQKASELLGLLWHRDPTLLALAALDVWALLYGVSWLMHKVYRRYEVYTMRNWLKPTVWDFPACSGCIEPKWSKDPKTPTTDGDLEWQRSHASEDRIPGLCVGCLGVMQNRGSFWHCPACGRIESITQS